MENNQFHNSGIEGFSIIVIQCYLNLSCLFCYKKFPSGTSIYLSLVPWLATTATFKNIATCPGFIGRYGGHAEVNGTGGLKGETGYENRDRNGDSGPAGTEHRWER